MRLDSIQLTNSSETPLYLQLADILRRAIRFGKVLAGERLPSIRRLADIAGVNPATAVSAYRILEKEGWVEARAGSGVYARLPPEGGDAALQEAHQKTSLPDSLADLASGKISVPPGALDLAAGAPSPGLFPTAKFKILLDEVLDRDGGWAFGYQESAGWPPFREAIAEYLRDAHGIQAETADVRVVSGAQQGIDLAAKALLGPRDAVAVEAPTYRGASTVFWSRGAETLAIPIDRNGMDLNELERIAAVRKPRLVYVIPRYQNPTTICWSAERMRGLLDLARRYDFYVLEDDLLSDLSYGPRMDPTCLKAIDDDDRVIYVRGFSKVLMPGIRLGAVLAPRSLRDRFEAAKRATDISTDGLVQRAVDLYLRRGLHRGQLDALRLHYAKVYAAAVEAADRLRRWGVRFDPPRGGLHLWLSLPEGTTGAALQAACLARGCSIVPEAVYGNGGLDTDTHIRVSFAAVDAEAIDRGLAIVGEAIALAGC